MMNGTRVSRLSVVGDRDVSTRGESSYGLVVHLLLLSTPLHSGAVTVGYSL